MLKKITALLLVGAMLLLAACSGAKTDTPPTSAENEGKAITFTDDTGRVVTLDKQPVKTAVMFSSLADIWVTAGGEVNVTVGEAVERGFAAEGTPLADEGAGKTLNAELLIAEEPDFVIFTADIQGQTEAAEIIRNAGIPCASFSVDSFEDYLRVLDIFTTITGNKAAYEEYGTCVKAEIDAILAGVPADAGMADILFIRAGSGAKSTKAKTADDHFAAAILKDLGTHNIAEDATVLLDGLSTEAVIAADPDMIFISTMGDENEAKAYMNTVLEEQSWQTLTAVTSGRVFYLPKDLFQYKPDARWAEAYKYLADILYPEGVTP